jgi:hypothetical protein
MSEQVVGFYHSTANRILNRLGSGNEQSFQEWNRGRGGGAGRVKYFRLQEDAATTRIPIYAVEVFDDGSLGTEYVEVYSRFNWLLVAKVDQNLMAIWNGEKSRWDYVPGHCIVFNNAHNQNAAIDSTYTPSGGTPQDAPNGTVGTSYSHTITTASLTGAPTVTQLPPGLSASWNSGPATVSISGTPTTAGVYYIKLVGTPTGGASGDFRTRLVKVVVNV